MMVSLALHKDRFMQAICIAEACEAMNVSKIM